jgi:hypothetical protein
LPVASATSVAPTAIVTLEQAACAARAAAITMRDDIAGA